MKYDGTLMEKFSISLDEFAQGILRRCFARQPREIISEQIGWRVTTLVWLLPPFAILALGAALVWVGSGFQRDRFFTIVSIARTTLFVIGKRSGQVLSPVVRNLPHV